MVRDERKNETDGYERESNSDHGLGTSVRPFCGCEVKLRALSSGAWCRLSQRGQPAVMRQAVWSVLVRVPEVKELYDFRYERFMEGRNITAF
jgi:hypothetical protein